MWDLVGDGSPFWVVEEEDVIEMIHQQSLNTLLMDDSPFAGMSLEGTSITRFVEFLVSINSLFSIIH